MFEASNRGGNDSSLLAHYIDVCLALSDSLWMAVRVRLDAIPPAEETLCNLVRFAFVASHLFSAGGRHSSAISELLCLIEILEELHTKVQGIISSPYLSTTIPFNVSRLRSLYLRTCSSPSRPLFYTHSHLSAF